MRRIALQEFIDAIGTDREVEYGEETEIGYFKGVVTMWKPPEGRTRGDHGGDFLIMVRGSEVNYNGQPYECNKEIPSKLLRWANQGTGTALGRVVRRLRI